MSDQELKEDNTTQPGKFDERFRNLLAKIRPYIKRLWELRKKLIIINAAAASIIIFYLYLLTKPYYESSVTILPEYGSKSTTLSGLTQLAAIAGVRVGGEGASSEIYQNLLKHFR